MVTLRGIPQAGAEENLVLGKDRIDVPIIGDGLCLHNLFQTGMVRQRGKPIRILGWAEPGENVRVTFADKTQACTVAADRPGKGQLPALAASSVPQPLVVQGKATTLKLDDILIGDVWLLGGQSNMEFSIHSKRLILACVKSRAADYRCVRLWWDAKHLSR